MSSNLDELIPEFEPFARDLVVAAGRAGLQPRVTSTRRSHADQKRLYDRFLAGASLFPAAPPGTSAHEFGYAFDMIVSPMDALPDVGAYWKSLGGVWFPSDAIHFQYPGFVVPKQHPDNFIANSWVGAEIRSLAEWFDGLPWYVTMFVPGAMLTERVDQDTAQNILNTYQR